MAAIGAGKPTLRKLNKGAKWFWAAGILISLFWALKLYIQVDWTQNNLYCAFHDDNTYIQICNLLKVIGKETTFVELQREGYGMDSKYALYHYTEFYLIHFFSAFWKGNSAYGFHFFLKPLFFNLSILLIIAFGLSRSKQNHFWVLFIVSVCILISLRFILLDDIINSIFPSNYWKSVFFQNYYFSSMLSYHVSYKICIAIFAIIPFFHSLETNRINSSVLFFLFSFILSLANVPYLLLMAFFHVIYKIDILTKLTKLILPGIFVFGLLVFFRFSPENSSIFKTIFGFSFSNFNLVFENFYWMCFPIFGFMAITEYRSNKFWFYLLFLLFPIVYIYPSILFKVYFFLIILISYFAFNWNILLKNRLTVLVVYPILSLIAIHPLLNQIPNADQVFTNALFPSISILLVFIVSQKLIFKWRKSYSLLIFAWVMFVQIPSIAYDQKTPLHKESLPDELRKNNVWKDKIVRLVSISKYEHFPAIDEDMRGSVLFNSFSNIVNTLAGFEHIHSDDRNFLNTSGFLNSHIVRLPYFSYAGFENKSLEHFCKSHDVRVITIDNKKEYEHLLNIIEKFEESRYYIPETNYYIVITKPWHKP